MLKRLLFVPLLASALFAQAPTVKWEYLIAGDCSAATTTCVVGQGAAIKVVLIDDLGASGWELVSAIPQGRNMMMIFKRPVAPK